MKKALLLVPLALIGIVLYMLWGGGETPSELGSAAVERGQPSLDEMEAEIAAPAVPAAVDEGRREVVSPVASPAPDLYRIRVVNMLTGDPVPGAEVSYSERSSNPFELMRNDLDHEARAREQGTTLIADGEGLAFIRIERAVMVTGRDGTLYGELPLAAIANRTPDEESMLELERDLTLRVQVLDFNGDPLPGIAFGIAPVYEDGDSRNPSSAYQLAESASPDGEAAISHVQLRLRSMQQGPCPIAYFLRPVIPGFLEGGVAIDPDHLPEDPVVLRLPETGRVLVGIVDPRGNRLPDPPSATVRLAVSPDQRAGTTWSARFEDGIAAFERVVAGRTYHARTSTFDSVFQGPRQQGDEVALNLQMDTGYWSLRGRILDPESAPLADARVRVDYDASGAVGTQFFNSDAGGFFWVYMRTADRAVESASLEFMVNRPGMFPLTADLRQPLQLGENDLGDVVLVDPRPEFVASGRVLIDGEPIRQWPQGRFTVSEHNPDTGGRMNSNARIDREPDGRFTIRTLDPGTVYRLEYAEVMREPEFLPVPVLEFEMGTEGLELNLETPGFLTADVLIADTPSLDNLWLRLVPTDGQVPQADLNAVPSHSRFNRNLLYAQPGTAADGRQPFHWRALWPGGYVLEVLPRGGHRPLVSVPNIRIEKGPNSDPRLHGLDLRGSLREIRVAVTDPEGRRVERPLVVIRDSGTRLLQGYRPRDGNPAVILVAESYLDLLVTARGYQPRELDAVSADTRVILEPFLEVTIRIAGGLPDLGSGRALEVSLEDDRAPDERDYTSDSGSGPLSNWLQPLVPSRFATAGPGRFGERNEVVLQFAGAGVHRLGLFVVNTLLRKTEAVAGFEPAEVDLAAQTGQVIEIRIPEERLREALERVK